MKKIISLFLICLMLAGCGANTPEPAEADPAPATTSTEAPTQVETEPTAATEAPTIPPVLMYTVYMPNENADGFDWVLVETTQITADGVLAALQSKGVLPETVIINAFGSEGTQLNIDFNQAFADMVCSMGTSGELMIIGSVVNTYLNAFQAESVYLTINGEILESGHVIYDFPITFTE